MPTEYPKITVAIISWNSAAHLPHCLDNLGRQSFSDFELVIVDNGSTDGGTDGLALRYPNLDLRVEQIGDNRGFAVANNVAARLAHGEWLVLLNADAFPEPDWLEELVRAARQSGEGHFFTSRQVQAGDPSRLDGEGDIYHVSGLAWRHNFDAPVYPAQECKEVFSACAAAAMYPRRAFLEAGGFDEDYFAYFEDVDLGFRLQLRGLSCVFVPRAIVHHVGSASTSRRSDFVIYHGHRNLVWTFVKDMPTPLFWFYLPLHLLMNLFYLASFTLKGQASAIWRAKRDALLGLPAAIRKRRAIQHARTVPPNRLRGLMSRGFRELLQQRAQRRLSGED